MAAAHIGTAATWTLFDHFTQTKTVVNTK